MSIDNPAHCIPNIGPGESQKRFRMGIVMLMGAIGLAIVLMAIGANRWWRVGLFLPLWVSTLGFFQTQEKT